jgi:outer membrane receptor protein involved in Fe transport
MIGLGITSAIFMTRKVITMHSYFTAQTAQHKSVSCAISTPAKRLSRVAVIGAFVLLSWTAIRIPGFAQATDGSILGVAADASGGALAGVSVTVRNVETGISRTTATGPDGHFRLDALPTGAYDLQAQRDGFAVTQVNNLDLTVGLELERDIVLKVGSVGETVNVTAEQPEVDTTSNEVGAAVIQRDQVDNLPIAGRQATQLSLLLPTTGTDTTRAQRPDANVGLGDQNVAATNYLVDGLTNMISGAGDPRDNIQQASIQEFQVIISQTPAEYGGRSGGVVTLVTKSGTNNVHGEAFEFFRDHYINRVDYFTQLQHTSDPSLYPIEPFNRNQAGGAIGGPILKDRLHYFGSYEYFNDQEYFTVAPGGIAPPTSVVGGQTVQDYASQEGGFRTGSLQNSYFGRIDWRINASHNAFLHFFKQTPSVFYCLGCTGGNSSNYSTGDTAVPGWTYAAGETWVISPRVVNQFGAQVAQDWQTSKSSHFYTPPQNILNNANFIEGITGDVPAGIAIAPGSTTSFSFPNFKWGFYPGINFHPFYQEAFDGITITRGSHTFKFGADVLSQPRKLQAADTPLGAWTFSKDIYFDPTDPNFNWSSLANAVPTKFTMTYPTIPYINYNIESAFYGQDEWKVSKRLTLNLGLRYDLQTKVFLNNLYASLYPSPGLPSWVQFGKHGAYTNFAPRVGFTWDPVGDGKTVIRGGYGIVYTVNSNNVYGEGETVTLRQTSIAVNGKATSPVSFPDPFKGLGYAHYVSTTPPNITVEANQVSNPPVNTISVGGTRQLTPELALIVDGIYSKMTRFQITPNVNTPYESSPGVATTNPATYPNPIYTNITEVEPEGNYEYKVLAARLDKRYSHHFEGTLSYTLGKQRDNYNNSGTWTDFYYPELDKGQAVADRRNMLVSSGYTKLPWGITVGGIYTLRSSLPLIAETGIANDVGATTEYVPGTSKNQHSVANLLAAVNKWRATQASTTSGYLNCAPGIAECLAPIPASQIEKSFYNQLDIHINKDIRLSERYSLQVIGQLFNVFGTDNFGGVGSSQQANASSSSFGTISSALPRQQGELAVRFLF